MSTTYKNQILVNGKEKTFRTSETTIEIIALERHEKLVAWAEMYSQAFGYSVAVNMFIDDSIVYSVDFEY